MAGVFHQQSQQSKPIMLTGNSSIVLIVLVFLLSSCHSLPENKVTLVPNPTKYVFKCDKDTLRNVIISNFSNLKYRHMMLYYNGGSFRPLDSLDIFSNPENKDDFYLTPSFIWIGESYMYPGLHYVAGFQLHLTQIDDSHIELKVLAIKPRVILGRKFLPSLPHFVRSYEYHEVPSSTIEEYEIIYRIGKSLNEDMPEVKYPRS